MMSDNVPFEIQAGILNKVFDLKSLIRFRSVSKQWKSLIESSQFITDHTLNHRNDTHHLLVRYFSRYSVANGYKFVSIVDDDSLPLRMYSHVVPPPVKNFGRALMLHSSQGLVCLYGCGSYDANVIKSMIVLWNPLIGKSVGITFAHKPTATGFGVCPKTSNPTIFKISQSFKIQPVSWKVEVFTLSSHTWRSIPMNMHLSISTRFSSNQVVVDGVIYWAISGSPNDSISKRIISFDLISEEFEEVALPDEFRNRNLYICKLKDQSLVVMNIDEWEEKCDVWMMKKNGFAKLFTTGAHEGFDLYGIIRFTQNGQPIRDHRCGRELFSVTKLEAYDPSTKRSRDLGIYLPNDSDPYFQWNIMITSYTQSLLLLDHSESIVQG